MADVRVNYASRKPAQLQALAYVRGNEIHLGPGQEKQLPHEAWHVVQQMQGRVKPTLQLKAGIAVNDDPRLEREADIMGSRALNSNPRTARRTLKKGPAPTAPRSGDEIDRDVRAMADILQRMAREDRNSGGERAADGDAFLDFAVMATELMARDGGDGWGIGADPIQMRLKVGRNWISVAQTITARVTANGGNAGDAATLIHWAGDTTKKGRDFATWAAAIAAARAHQGIDWPRVFLILGVILLIIAVLFAPYLGLLSGWAAGGGQDAPAQVGPDDIGVVPADLPNQFHDLQHNENLAVMHEMAEELRGRARFDPEKAVEDWLGHGHDVEEILRPVEDLEPEVTDLEDAILPRREHIVTTALEQPIGSVPHRDLTPFPSEVDLASDPRIRAAQIRELNRRYLAANVDVIRIHTHALAGQLGRGHQAAAAAVMEQLIRDYHGAARIEIIVDADPDAMYVFQNLLPGFNARADRQTLSSQGHEVTVIRQGSESPERSLLRPERAVGILPADDLEIWDKGVTDISATGELMRGMNTQSLIALNPHRWGDDPRFIDTGSQSFPITSSESSIYRGSTYRDLGRHPMSPVPEVVQRNILNLVNLVQEGRIDLWATYGLHFTESTQSSSMRPGDEISFGMVAAGTMFQSARENPRPLVIINLSRQNPMHTEMIRGHDRQMLGETQTHFSFEEMNQPLRLNITGSHNVMFVDMVSGIPRDWFSMIMDHSTLPIAYEGANTANLAHQLGRPFLPMRPVGSTPLVEIEGFEEGRDRLEQAGKALAGPSRSQTDPQIVATVLLELQDPDSAVSKYVAEVLKRASQPEADQVLMAIYRLRDTRA